MRAHHGPGDRLYFMPEAETVVVLCGAARAVGNATSKAPGSVAPGFGEIDFRRACPLSTMLANMTEDERQDLLRTVAGSHASLSEVALKLRLELPPKAQVLKTAMKAERVAFYLKRTLQKIVVEDLEHANEGKSLPEVRRGAGDGPLDWP